MDPRLYFQMFASVFCDQLDLLIASKNFLLESIDQLFTLYGVYSGSCLFPSIYELSDFLFQRLKNERVKSSKNYAYCETVANRIKGMITVFPDVLNCSSGMPLHVLTRGNTIIELHGIDFEYQALFVTLMLTYLCCYRIANDLRNRPEHNVAVILDESSSIFDAQLERRLYQGIPTITRLLATVRKYGLMLHACAQQNSLVCSSLKANAGVRIMLPLREGSDVRDMSESMMLTPEQVYFTRLLERGQGVVKLGSRYLEPFIVRIPNAD